MNKDYFIILGVTKNSTQEEIKTAFFEKALLYHPDKIDTTNKTEKEIEELKKIYTEKYFQLQQAYKTLSNPEKLAEYKKSMFPNFDELKNNSINENIPIDDKLKNILSNLDSNSFNTEFNKIFEEKKQLKIYKDFDTKINDSYLENKEKERNDEINVPKIFNNFDIDEFNGIFDKYNTNKNDSESKSGEIVSYNEPSSIFSFKNTLVEINESTKLLCESPEHDILNSIYDGFIINDTIKNNIKDDIKDGVFKNYNKNNLPKINKNDFDNFINKYTQETDRLNKLADNDFIITKTDIEKDFAHLFIDYNDVEQLLPVQNK